MVERPDGLRALKREIRAQGLANRRRQQGKDLLSRRICGKLATLPEYQNAATVAFYVDFRCEVRTRPFLPSAWEQGKRVVVPYCAGDRLELYWVEGLDELAPGAYGILEPPEELRRRDERKVDVAQVDLIVVPGVAFDRHGGRVGHGKGYYDRLLRQARPHTPRVALAFQCQLFPQVPMMTHDVYVDKVITEEAVYSRGV